MLHDVILLSLIALLVPLCTVVVMRAIAKKKRERRPVQNFRLD